VKFESKKQRMNASRKQRRIPGLAKKILAQVSERDIVEMACDVINIPSPTGDELVMAEYMRSRFAEMGLRVTWQEVEHGRANVIGTLEGSAAGPRLMFNGHMDTSNTGEEDFLTGIGYKPRAVLRDGFLYGLGIYNMKGALVCYTQAVRALQKAGVELAGGVLIAAVCGEIEKTQWGEHRGRQFRGYGVGSHALVTGGAVPDMCILGEPTDMKIVLEHFGSLWARLSVRGLYVHSAFSSGRHAEHSVHRLHTVMNDVLAWIPQWEKKASYGGKRGIANLGCVQAGHAWRVSRTPDRADLFLDLRVPPTMKMAEARRTAQQLYLDLKKKYPDFGLEFETFVSVPGARIAETHPMVAAIEHNHKQVTGRAPQYDTVTWCSDASVLTRYDIPTVNYGPSSGPRDKQGEKVAIETLVDMTKIYALTAAEICGAS
jgi:acetylornithine deacetylase